MIYPIAAGPGLEGRTPPSKWMTAGAVISTHHPCYPACWSLDTWYSGFRIVPLHPPYNTMTIGRIPRLPRSHEIADA